MSSKVSDICEINQSNISKNIDWEYINYLDTANLNEGTITELKKLSLKDGRIPSRAKRLVKEKDILISTVRPNQKHYGIIKEVPNNLIVSTGFTVLTPEPNKVDEMFLYYYLTQQNVTSYLQSIAEGSTSAYPSLRPKVIGDLVIDLPILQEQKAIANILSSLDEKIEVNNQINETLENMAQALFKEWFVDFEFPNEEGEPYKSSGGEMVESELGLIPKGWKVNKLGDSVNFIDNRGKTPPLSKMETGYPIIDVKALSTSDRVVDYENCTKYVSEETYNTWFRSGHPQQGDILLSTVGSIGEMKLHYGDIGCIAQNVVALRTKNISYVYLYQYLKNIKNILKAYNIGSVQPSIKVTHLKNQKIIIPELQVEQMFVNVSSNITNIVYLNNLENKSLYQTRNTLLPKLMSGDIRVPIDETEESLVQLKGG